MEIISKYEDYEGLRYTYKDYLQWPEDERWELIDGVPYSMSPAPSKRHQEICLALCSEFYNYLKGEPCKAYIAPFDVRLVDEGESDDDASTVLQPDIVVICDRTKLDKAGCKGTPDLVVEITSPYTAKKDVIRKFAAYEKFGVKEYWIVRPEEETVTVFKLSNENKYGRPEIYCRNDKIQVGIFDDLIIQLEDIFKD
ncbi:MAG TPA: Uma2 family endonuclease [Clostridiales bacterium]|nr:Uma2 family endonuclease [Clostridiales bacterium]